MTIEQHQTAPRLAELMTLLANATYARAGMERPDFLLARQLLDQLDEVLKELCEPARMVPSARDEPAKSG